MRNWHNNMYDRMDPFSAERLRKMEAQPAAAAPPDAAAATAAAATDDTAPTTESERRQEGYTYQEVMDAFNSPQARPLNGVPVELAEATIATGWQAVGAYREQEQGLAEQHQEMRVRLQRARTELRNVRLCVDHILAQRERQRQEREEEQQGRRLARQNRRILRQVSSHLREVQYQGGMYGERLGRTAHRAEITQLELQLVQVSLEGEVARAGLEDLEAVREEAGEAFLARLEELEDEPAELE